jgi:hypothetical protein
VFNKQTFTLLDANTKRTPPSFPFHSSHTTPHHHLCVLQQFKIKIILGTWLFTGIYITLKKKQEDGLETGQ